MEVLISLRKITFLKSFYFILLVTVYGLCTSSPQLLEINHASLATHLQTLLPKCGFGPQVCVFDQHRTKGTDLYLSRTSIHSQCCPQEYSLPAPGAWVVITWRGYFRIADISVHLIDVRRGRVLWAHTSNAPKEHDGTDFDGSIRFRMPNYPQGTRGLLTLVYDLEGMDLQFIRDHASDVTTLILKFHDRRILPDTPLCRCM